MKIETAERIHQIMDDIAATLEDLLRDTRGELTEHERAALSAAVREILGVVLLDIKTPLYKQHPELVPESLKDLFE